MKLAGSATRWGSVVEEIGSPPLDDFRNWDMISATL